ncbi:inactive TPR repeat-containing thioredoxin TTL3-like [Typha angustifolia]|uniref:inactive TPR repeat-containing thioredoxin TTL3-like n=1 Tax=Typha angustifolia TaxID=59011 RepID=UPI003C2E0709
MDDEKRPSGCGVLAMYGGIFRRRRSASTSSIPRFEPDVSGSTKSVNAPRFTASDNDGLPPPSPGGGSKSLVPAKAPAVNNQKAITRRPPPNSNALTPAPPSMYNGVAADLDKMIHDHQRVKGSSTLVRASSGNVMVFGNLGNLRGHQNTSNPPNRNVLDYLPKTAKELKMENEATNNHKHSLSNGLMGNIVKNAPPAIKEEEETKPELCRALSRRLNPEELKEMGNEEYKQGRFAEALALYDRAIVMDPEKASYWSNKAAALTGMGRFLEAVGECKEAVRIDPFYYRAHHRLATLYLRLGEPDKAIHHYKQSLKEANALDISRAQSVKSRIAKCNDARKLKDWITVLKESQAAVSDGADSAPLVLALQAEALLKLQRHDEADSVFNNAPKFDLDASKQFFGYTENGYVLMIRAQVDMAAGRFEEAVTVAQMASQLDPGNREINIVIRRTRAVTLARSKGNDLFKASKFAEACIAYGEGLGKESHNAVLLCNRAACHSKLGHYERAIEDCTTALAVRPSYSKARLRRADCNTKLERWEASIRDYQVLIQEMPENEEVSKALSEAEAQLKKQRNEEEKDRPQS